MKRKPYHKSKLRSKGQNKRKEPPVLVPQTQARLDKVMADSCSPYPQQPSVQGNKIFFLILDVHTRKSWILFAKSKAEFPSLYKKWLKEIETETKITPILFMPDGGTEFVNKKLRAILEESGTKFRTTCPGNPNQNPFVERLNGVVEEKIRKLLDQANLPERYWQDAARFVVEIQNAMPHKALDFDTPNSRWEPDKEDKTLAYCHTFGCTAWYLVNNSEQLRKGVQKYRKGMYLGTSEVAHGFKICDLATRKVVNTRDVVFDETDFPYDAKKNKETRSKEAVEQENEEVIIIIIEPQAPQAPQLSGPG
jgi:hypothetical protein